MQNRTARLSLVALFVMTVFSLATAKESKLSPKTALKEAKEAIAKVADSSDPQIRLAVFTAKLSLAGKRNKRIVEEGMQSDELLVKEAAIAIGLKSKNKALKVTAVEGVGALLCSEDAEQTAVGRGLEIFVRSKKQMKRLRSILVKCPGSLLAEKAKASMIKEGGKQAWDLIAKDLENDTDNALRNKAKTQALKSKTKAAANWAFKRIHDENELGDFARELMIGLADTRIGRSYTGRLMSDYRKSGKLKDEIEGFKRRLRLAMVLGNLSGVKKVQDTLFAAFTPTYVISHPKAPSRAWTGLLNVRDLKVLDRVISKDDSLTVKKLFCRVQSPTEAKAAYRWLYKWTKEKQSPKLYSILEHCFNTSTQAEAREAAIIALAKLGKRRSYDTFNAGLKDPNPKIRYAAARGIAAVAKKADEDRLVALLRESSDEEGQLALIKGLGRLGSSKITKALRFKMRNQPKSVMLAAMNVLAATKDPKNAHYIAQLTRNPDDTLRMTAWKHLLVLKPKQKIKTFVSSSRGWLEPRHVESLARTKGISLEVFSELAQRSKAEVSSAALKVLAKHGEEGASYIIDTVNKHKDGGVAADALALLASLEKGKATSLYVKMMDHAKPQVRFTAIRLVGKHGSKKTHLPLVSSKRTDSDVVTSIAAHLATYKLSKKRK